MNKRASVGIAVNTVQELGHSGEGSRWRVFLNKPVSASHGLKLSL